VLINDVFGAHSPLVNFSIKDSDIVILKTAEKMTLTSSLLVELNFFNPYIGRWEPIIEPSALNIDMHKGQSLVPPFAIGIDTNSENKLNPINVNLSHEFITIVSRDMKICM